MMNIITMPWSIKHHKRVVKEIKEKPIKTKASTHHASALDNKTRELKTKDNRKPRGSKLNVWVFGKDTVSLSV